MIKSGFYDSINHDRLYGADDFSDYFEGFLTGFMQALEKNLEFLPMDLRWALRLTLAEQKS